MLFEFADPERWTVAQVSQWLISLGFEKHAKQFAENEINGICLQEGLDDETLIALEVALPVHRNILRKKAAELFAKL